MKNQPRKNIFELLKSDILVYETLIDIGCGELNDLVDFENSQFENLFGIEKKFITNDFGAYFRIKKANLKLSPESERELKLELLEVFNSRFKIYYTSFLNFEFSKDVYSLIICNKVLHFYTDEQKYDFIEMFHNSLQPNGLLYLRINHSKHPNNTDLNLMDNIGINIYQNKNVENDIRYLIDERQFIEALNIRYNILEHLTSVDEETVTIVIRK
jgi:SAM-dependent methyltransferase